MIPACRNFLERASRHELQRTLALFECRRIEPEPVIAPLWYAQVQRANETVDGVLLEAVGTGRSIV